jgi:hypothetical protein
MRALDKIETKAKKIAAHLMEAATPTSSSATASSRIKGTDKKVTFGQVALTAYVPHNYPLDKLEPGLNETAFYDPTNFTFPAGTYICEVEVDPATGDVRLDRFTAVDDFGTIINPMIVEGQVHGGLVQGIGQALMEQCVYDKESGQLLTGSLHGLRPAARRRPADLQAGHRLHALHAQPAGHQGLRRGGRHRLAAGVINAVLDALKRRWASRTSTCPPPPSRTCGRKPSTASTPTALESRITPCTHSPSNVPPIWPTPAALAAAGGTRCWPAARRLLASMKLRLAAREAGRPGRHQAELAGIKKRGQCLRDRRHDAPPRRRRQRRREGGLSRAGLNWPTASATARSARWAPSAARWPTTTRPPATRARCWPGRDHRHHQARDRGRRLLPGHVH